MSPFRPDRTPRGADPLLPHKMALFALGAGCAFAGMLFDVGWLITVGAIVLAIGVFLGLIGRRRREAALDADEEEPPGDERP